MEIFGILLRINANWRPLLPTDTKNILTRETRKAIMKDTKINKNNLSKYLSDMKENNLIVQNAFGGWEINPMFVPMEDSNKVVRIIFTLGVQEDEES